MIRQFGYGENTKRIKELQALMRLSYRRAEKKSYLRELIVVIKRKHRGWYSDDKVLAIINSIEKTKKEKGIR